MADKPENQATGTPSEVDEAEDARQRELYLDAAQGRVARTLRKQLEAKRRERQELYKTNDASAKGASRFTPKQYRQLRTAMRTLQAGSAVGTSLGDVFFSLAALFLSINVSRFVLPRVLPGYELEGVDKILFKIGWLIILLALFVIGGVFIGLAYYADKIPGAAQVLKKII